MPSCFNVQMLPEACVIDDVSSNANSTDTDTTLTKRRSFGDQYLLFVRQNTREFMESNFPPGRENIRDMIILQDECFPPLQEILHRIDYSQLTSLYIIDCKLNLDDDAELLRNLRLTSLVLSHTYLRRLPRSLFQLSELEVLKLDRNCLAEIPSDIGSLKHLKCFVCDSQTPRLRSLPTAITQLQQLLELSFSNNRVDNVAWVVHLPRLRILRFANNRVVRLPNQIVNMRDLVVLDCSHNRLEYIPATFTDLIRRLYCFSYHNLTLRPRHVRRDRNQLLSALELENFLAQSPARRSTIRDVSVGVVGESRSGKSTLVEALKSDKGLCKTDIRQESRFEVSQFEMQVNDATCFLSTLILANDILDPYTRQINVDIYLLTVDLTTLELQNGSQHLFARHINRMQMWLQALYELAPDTPVLIVGTHAELVKSIGLGDIWHIMERFLDQGRAHHAKRFADGRLSHCILCNAKSMAVRQVGSGSSVRSKTCSAGFVDLSTPHNDGMMNGHMPNSDQMPPGRLKLPHIIGYYEIDSRKNLPKDPKKSNQSIDQLKSAIMRLTAGSPDDGIPLNWMSFIQHVATITEQAPGLPCVLYEEVISISRSCDIPPAQVPFMLQYFHQRGKVVYFDGDDTLSKLVVINPTWFIMVMNRLLESHDNSQATFAQLFEVLQDKELDRQLQKANVTVTSAEWLLSALQRLEIVLPLPDFINERHFLLPNLLERGCPDNEVWSDVPEWDEKQITCDFALRSIKPCLYIDLVLRLNGDGRRQLEIVSDPPPVFMAHHIVFYTSIDVGGCEDCYTLRQRLHRHEDNNGAVWEGEPTTDDVLHKVHVEMHPRLDAIRIAVRGVSPCCVMKSVLNYLELHLDDLPEDESETASSSDRTSISSQALSTSASHTSEQNGGSMTLQQHNGNGGAIEDSPDEERQFFLLCPKCVLMRHSDPERISYHAITSRRKAICSRWHNLGSWTRAVTGDYRFAEHILPPCILSKLPDYEHPRLALVLPPSGSVSTRDWYMFSRMRFLEGYEVHFLCEYTGFWHLTEDTGYRLSQSQAFLQKVGKPLPPLLNMVLTLVQVVNGIHEHPINARLMAPVVGELIKTYEYLRTVDAQTADPYAWLMKNKERMVNMLTKVIANVSDGLPDLYFKVGSAINADAVFQSAHRGNRREMARYLRIEADSGKFGSLRPLYVGREIRWLCDAHYEELRSMPST